MMRLEQAPFSVVDLVHSVVMMFHQKIEEKGLKIEVDLSADLPATVWGDATRLTQILVNLIGNAIKFTEVGGIQLSIVVKSISQGSVELVFSIVDSGIGIEEDKLDTIFERFRQAEDSTTRKFGGTGLGLSIVRDLVHLQNGNIEVKSEVGAGTKIEFVMPYQRYEEAPLVDRFDTVLSEDKVPTDLKILVVEDNVINQGVISHLLEGWGLVAKIANHGKEALEMLRIERFDLIFMDIQMPEMDGYTTTYEIRNSLRLNVPIIAMTANAMAGERDKCLSYGMNDHISKPIREVDVKKALLTLFTHKVKSQPYNEHNSKFKTIDLTYIKEIGDGDLEYEKMVTEQFLHLVPMELNALQKACETHDVEVLRRTAHSMKTSISVMGLGDRLDQALTDLEHGQLELREIQGKVNLVTTVCQEALIEARQFYSEFIVSNNPS